VNYYLFDTHALIFWNTGQGVSKEFVEYFDKQAKSGKVLVSSISFWEAALLSKKGRIAISNVEEWKSELSKNTDIRIIETTASEMIESVLLPDHHKDPFDRLLIVQTKRYDALLVSKDTKIRDYGIETFWL